MHWGWKWTGIFLAAGVLDYAIRVATRFNMAWVVPSEAALFLATSLLLWFLQHQSPAQVRWQRAVQLGLIASFALGGLRSLLWAAGLAVSYANVIVMVLGVVLVAAALRRRRAAA
jgi:hypothetical protein